VKGIATVAIPGSASASSDFVVDLYGKIIVGAVGFTPTTSLPSSADVRIGLDQPPCFTDYEVGLFEIYEDDSQPSFSYPGYYVKSVATKERSTTGTTVITIPAYQLAALEFGHHYMIGLSAASGSSSLNFAKCGSGKTFSIVWTLDLK
jgi:hypothetical protein